MFATETLAAGVNMPARATVITTLSKRIDTGIVKLNPSQLLQMGGRYARNSHVSELFEFRYTSIETQTTDSQLSLIS